MYTIPFLFIILCYVILVVTWISSAFSTKKTIKKSSGWTLRIFAIAIVITIIYLQKNIPDFAIILWSRTLVVQIVADIIVFLGLVTMILARIVLGRNWSGNVVLKEGHELITSGPYKYVRHPIYSGLLLMILGTTIYEGNFPWVLLFVLFFVGAYFKAMKEEEVLIGHFQESYLQYKKQVKALIPYMF